MSNMVQQNNMPDIASCPLCLEMTSRVELKHARQISGGFSQKLESAPGPKSVEIDNSTRVEVDKENLHMFVFVDFNLRASMDTEADPTVRVNASFLLAYELTHINGLTDEHYSQFAKVNGVFNAWPYWREYVQNATSRMGLPALTIPVLCLYKPKKVADETSVTEDKAGSATSTANQ